MRLSLVAVALIAACSSKGASRGTPKGEPMALAVAPPVATPGERISYKLTLKGVELGQFLLGVGEIVDLDGAQTVVVQAQAKSSGLAALVAGDVDDRFTSWVDVKTGRPRRFEVFEHVDRKSKDKDHVVVDFAARKGNTIPVHYGLNDEPMKTIEQPVTQNDVWDYNAFLLAIRGWEGEKGSTATLEVFRSRYLWKVTVTLGGKGTLVTDLGELPVLRFDAKMTKIGRDGQRWPNQDDRTFTLWISDDNDRVPLKLDATSDFGSISMSIIDYQPGNGTRLRP